MGSDPLPAHPWTQVILIVILVLVNAMFACAEIAVISFNDYKLRKMAEDGNKKAARLMKLTKQPARFLSTIQIGITLAGFLASAFAADNFSGYITDWLDGFGTSVPRATWGALSVVLITVALSYFSLVFGELVPKRVAMKYSEKIAMRLSGPVYFISRLTAPAVTLLTASTNGMLRLLGINPEDQEDEVTEEEIRFMVDVGSEKGTIAPEEKDMIQNIFEFDNISAENVMTHRTEVTVLMRGDSPGEWEKIARETGYSRFPLCGETIDDIIGVVHARELYEFLYDNNGGSADDIIRPAYVVPETVAADVLFRNMQKRKQHMAIVVDEYGGFSGVVTLDDLLEEIVGDIDDETDDEDAPPEIVKLDENTWKIAGIAPLDEVGEELLIKLPTEEYDTFGGLIYGQIDAVPNDGETFELEAYGLLIKVTEILDRRIESTTVCKVSPAKTEEKTGGE